MNFSSSSSRRGALLFWAKSSLLKIHRACNDRIARLPRFDRRFDRQSSETLVHVISECRSPLWCETAGAERSMELGKVENIRLAIRRLDGIVIPAGEIFS